MLKQTDGVIARLAGNKQDAKTAAVEGANLILLEVSYKYPLVQIPPSTIQ